MFGMSPATQTFSSCQFTFELACAMKECLLQACIHRSCNTLLLRWLSLCSRYTLQLCSCALNSNNAHKGSAMDLACLSFPRMQLCVCCINSLPPRHMLAAHSHTLHTHLPAALRSSRGVWHRDCDGQSVQLHGIDRTVPRGLHMARMHSGSRRVPKGRAICLKRRHTNGHLPQPPRGAGEAARAGHGDRKAWPAHNHRWAGVGRQIDGCSTPRELRCEAPAQTPSSRPRHWRRGMHLPWPTTLCIIVRFFDRAKLHCL